MEQITAKPPILISPDERLKLAESSAQFDFWNEVFYTVGQIFAAEEAIAGEAEKNLIERMPEITEQLPFGMSASEDADVFLGIKKIGLDTARLLKEDPTGQLLMRVSTENSVTNKYPYPIGFVKPMNLEWMIEGVKFAEQAYKTIYPFTEKI